VGSPAVDLLGIVVGHMYYFLEVPTSPPPCIVLRV
jgi:hypothetical protein